MELTEELKVKIGEVFANNVELREKLLNFDVDAIREIGSYGKGGISAQTVIDKIDNNESDKLYEIAKKKVMCTEVYFEYIGEKTSGNGKK